jgi:hypothetical protein
MSYISENTLPKGTSFKDVIELLEEQGQVFNFDFNSVLIPIMPPMSRDRQLITENINMGAAPGF